MNYFDIQDHKNTCFCIGKILHASAYIDSILVLCWFSGSTQITVEFIQQIETYSEEG